MGIAIVSLIEAALSIASDVIRRKYINAVANLKRDFYEEYNKPQAIRSDAVLGNIERELCIAAEALARDLRTEKAQD